MSAESLFIFNKWGLSYSIVYIQMRFVMRAFRLTIPHLSFSTFYACIAVFKNTFENFYSLGLIFSLHIV